MTPSPSGDSRQAWARKAAAHERRHALTLLATIIAFVLSAWLTAKGMFDRAIEAGVASPEGMVTAFMSSVVAATLLAVATACLFGVVNDARREQHRALIVLGGTLLPFILGISTYNAVLGNAGAPSLIDDMRDSAAAHGRYYEAATADASLASSAAAALEPVRDSICRMETSEREKGALTGALGKGGVYAALLSGCESVGTVVRTLHDTVRRNGERGTAAAAILSRLKSIPDDTTRSVFERQAAFRQQAGALREIVGSADAEDVTRRLRAQAGVIEASIITLDVRDGSFGAKQHQWIEGVRNSLAKAAGIVTALTGEAERAAPRAEPPAELLIMGAAVARYWVRNLPAIMIAVSSDLMLLWFVRLLAVSRATLEAVREPGVQPRRRTARTTFKVVGGAKR